MNSFSPLSRALDAAVISEVFDRLFLAEYNTVLLGGADEPLYLPAGEQRCGSGGRANPAEIHFRADYASSALHEVAHWCIAGPERRRCEDYGYWYNPDGRSADAQSEFLAVERRPQALEWCFSQAAGLRFRLSMDNLDAPPDPGAARDFAKAVAAEVAVLADAGLPSRASRFLQGLAQRRGVRISSADLCCEPGTLL